MHDVVSQVADVAEQVEGQVARGTAVGDGEPWAEFVFPSREERNDPLLDDVAFHLSAGSQLLQQL